jgi:signal transduction histidine kinase
VLNLVNDLLDAAQVKAGKFELVRKHFDLFALVQEVFSSMKV